MKKSAVTACFLLWLGVFSTSALGDSFHGSGESNYPVLRYTEHHPIFPYADHQYDGVGEPPAEWRVAEEQKYHHGIPSFMDHIFFEKLHKGYYNTRNHFIREGWGVEDSDHSFNESGLGDGVHNLWHPHSGWENPPHHAVENCFHRRGRDLPPPCSPVPEPSLMVLLGMSMMSVAGLRRWWKK